MAQLADLLGESPAIAALREQVRRLLHHEAPARRQPPVLIRGETGTGKGLLAQAIHDTSARSRGPFIPINCAAIPGTLLEAELFGVEAGAFTDARQRKAGLFQTAHRGTLFLDEVGALAHELQAKLLTAIEDRVVRRVGGVRGEAVDVWVLSATSAALEAAMAADGFRPDLYHRLATISLWLPPLRERGGDVLQLAGEFLARACGDYGRPQKTLTPDAQAAIAGYRWPGNVRELANVMERVALMTDAPRVDPADLALPGSPEPEAHVHLAVHRCGGAEVLMGLLLLAGAPVELAEAEVAVGDEGAHAARLGERERLAVVSLAALGIKPVGMGRDVAEQMERMGREPRMSLRGFEGTVAQAPRLVEAAEQHTGTT
jgi:DNA-binding NtrC family response regulator